MLARNIRGMKMPIRDLLVKHCPKDPRARAGYVTALIRIKSNFVADDIENTELFEFMRQIEQALPDMKVKP
jgi:hypothetical protein